MNRDTGRRMDEGEGDGEERKGVVSRETTEKEGTEMEGV